MDRSWVPDPPHRGGCLCGAARYSFNARPLCVVACHCPDCQKLSGATNALTVYVPRESFVRESGDLDQYRDNFRCATCGTSLWSDPPEAAYLTMVAAGTLDDPGWAIPVAHVWTSRAAPSAVIPEGVPAWEKDPPNRDHLIAIFQRSYPA